MEFSEWNNQFSGLDSFLKSWKEKTKPYVEMWKTVEQSMKSVLLNIAEKTKPIRAFYILADHQFTYWKPLDCDEVEDIINAYDVNQYLSERLETDARFIDYDVLCEEMLASELLSDTNRCVLEQSFKALEAGLYDLTLVGVVIVFDGVLSEATCDVSTNIKKRIESIRKKMENLSDEAWEHLEENEITVFGMYITWIETMKQFRMRREFDKPEDEPQGINRHWIAHGRKTTIATKLDCCKMINALYGLFYFGNSVLPLS